jgi:hypothetical protein
MRARYRRIELTWGQSEFRCLVCDHLLLETFDAPADDRCRGLRRWRGEAEARPRQEASEASAGRGAVRI